MAYKITVLKGDGIGPEIVDAALEVLDAAGEVTTPEVAILYGQFINTILEFFIIFL